MKKICKCVGLSGACNAKVCYRTLKPLEVSTDWLKKRYDTAKKVRAAHRAKRDGTRPLVTADGLSTPAKDDLIYLLDSPNYCKYDPNTGSLGTSGRQCNVCNDKSGLGSCDELCCGRGHLKHEMVVEKNCNCSFNSTIYKVNCQKCKEKVTIYRCK